MTIAAITEYHTEKDLAALFPGVTMRLFASVPDVHEPSVPNVHEPNVPEAREPNVPEAHDPAIDVWLDLDFVNEPARIDKLSRLLPALVLVNAVVPTLREIDKPFVRINAWPGFGVNKLHELVLPEDAAIKERVRALYEGLDCGYVAVPDVPGMISARVVAGIINEAWYTWEEKVSSKEEIDTAMRLGTNYPAGPFEWGERIGLGQIARLLGLLGEKEARYKPARSLTEAAGKLKCD